MRLCNDHLSPSHCHIGGKRNLFPSLVLVNEYFMRPSQTVAFVDSIDRYIVLKMLLMV